MAKLHVADMFCDSSDLIWVSTYEGDVITLNKGEVEDYPVKSDSPLRNVKAFAEPAPHEVWVGGAGGLALIDSGRIRPIKPEALDSLNDVTGVVDAGSEGLWLNTANGVIHVSKDEVDRALRDPSYRFQEEVFDSSDGLPGQTEAIYPYPKAVQGTDGRIWFTAARGVAWIDPKSKTSRNAIPPPVSITSISADSSLHLRMDNLRLPAHTANIEVDYTALSLSVPERVRFRYKVDGLDKGWQDVGTRRQAYYSNLGPGAYQFRVIACNNDGVWNQTGATLDFSILPAWYRTTWFRVSCVAAFAALLWMLYQLRVRSIQQRSEQLALINMKLETQIAENASLYTDLQRSEAFLAQGQKISRTGSFGRNVLSEKLYWSEETYEIYELDRSVQPTMGWLVQRIHPEDRVRVQQTIESAIHQKTGFDIEYRLLTQGGSEKYLHVVVQAQENASGELEFMGAVTDITQRNRAEEALRQAQGDLARINRVTTMGELAASLVHEVSQPISGTMTNANVSLRSLGSDKPDLDLVRTTVTRIARDAQRAAGIIARIRSQFEKGAPNQESLNVNEILQETIALLHDQAMRYNISVPTELAADLPSIVGDRVQLQQVAMNLIVNSIEAMKDVEGIRELIIMSQRTENGQILVSVSDTGPGFPPQLAEQIFDPFFTTKPHGTGMGLRISRSIVESHGGRLWAEMATGRGATFHLSLLAATQGNSPDTPESIIVQTATQDR
ncbi:MAG: ATP-binding protein [Terracidiphilus sp.]